MFKLFSQSNLQKLLKEYPPYTAPHPGKGLALTSGQACENLQFLLEQKPARIATFAGLVREYGIELKPSMKNANDPQPLVNALYQWSGENWTECFHVDIANRKHWLSFATSGKDIMYLVIMDAAIILGELIVTHRPSYSWDVDLDAQNIEDGMLTARRCVVQAPFAPDTSVMVITDVEQIAAERYYNHTNIRQRLDNAISGADEAEHLL